MQPIVRIPLSVHRHVIHYCMQNKPNEACGFLLGRAVGETLQVEKFYEVPNVAEDPLRHFVMDPSVMLPLVLQTSQDSSPIIGLLHSHPRAAAIPSIEDLQTPWHHIPSHWILSLLHEESPDWRVYQYTRKPNDATQYVPLKIHIHSD